jgi:DNA repair exonuclease SbcCD ATPase subunit
MKKFSDFLNFDYDQDEFFKELFDKIRELFYVYNKHMFDPIVDLINNKFQVKSDLSNKVQIVLKNEVNDCYENVTLMRKVLEDNFKDNQTKINELTNEKRIAENKFKELETKYNKQAKTLEEIGNRDYSNYYKQMKESNDMFLKEFEKIEKQRNEKLYEQYEKQLEKNKLLKKEIKENKSEIFALKKKIDNINAIKDKTGDDYIAALQEQFDDAKESFQEEISNITDEFYKKRKDLQQKCNLLENENKHLKGIQAAIIKKLDTMESLFSK